MLSYDKLRTPSYDQLRTLPYDKLRTLSYDKLGLLDQLHNLFSPGWDGMRH